MKVNDPNNVAQRCVEKGMPKEVCDMIDHGLWCMEETRKQFPEREFGEVSWGSININLKTLGVRTYGGVDTDAYVFKIGFCHGLSPFHLHFFPSDFTASDFARLLRLPNPESFFKPLAGPVNIEERTYNAFSANGGGEKLSSDGTLPLALCVMADAASCPGVTGVWEGYDVVTARYAIVVAHDSSHWMFVINYHDLYMSREGRTQ